MGGLIESVNSYSSVDAVRGSVQTYETSRLKHQSNFFRMATVFTTVKEPNYNRVMLHLGVLRDALAELADVPRWLQKEEHNTHHLQRFLSSME